MICVLSPVSAFEPAARNISCPYLADTFRLASVGQMHRALRGLEMMAPHDTFALIKSYAEASRNFLMTAEDPSESIDMRVGAIAAVGSGIQQLHDCVKRMRQVPAFSMAGHVSMAVSTVPILMTARSEIKFQDTADRLLGILRDPDEDVEVCAMALGVCAAIDEFCRELPGAFDHARYGRDLSVLALSGPCLGI